MVQSVNVLSIDLSSNSARATVVAVSGNVLRVIESHTCEINEASLSQLYLAKDSAENVLEKSPTSSSLPEPLLTLFNQIRSPWRSSVLTLPANHGFSINVSLPFADPKQIAKVLSLEVQDLIPFELNEFHLSSTSSSVKAANEDGQGLDVRVDLTQKAFLKGILSIFQKNGIDPRIVGLPTHVLASLVSLAPNYFDENCALIWVTEDSCTVLGVINKTPSSARTIPTKNSFNNLPLSKKEILREARLFIGHVERRYETSLSKIYVIGDNIDTVLIKETLARDLEYINPEDFIKDTATSDTMIISAALAYQAMLPTAKTISNFRCGEFQFRPQFKEIISGLKSLTPYIFGFLGAVLFGLLAQYYSNTHKIATFQTAMRDRIKKTIPSFNAPVGQEVSTISAMTQKIEEQLKELGSLSTLSPLEAFLAISEDLPSNLNIAINEVGIKETRITLKGTAPDYGTLDKIEQTFKGKKETYCTIGIKDNSSGSRTSNSGSVGFELTLQLC
ncbi:MAG: hypothetical protein SGJ02_14465 [bacterium]|nr:hypothetical protein [bacterium]